MSSFSLKDMHIVVVGASSGIGAETAIQGAISGARVSICARREEKLHEVLAKMPGSGHGCKTLDVRNTGEVSEVFDAFVNERGQIDGLVYATGISGTKAFSIISPENFMNILQVNLIGAMVCTQEAINIKRVNKSGCSLVWISSIASIRPNGAGAFMYSSSKAGMIGGIKVLALELAHRKIRINAVCPAAVKTDIWNDNLMLEEQKQKIFKRHPLGIGETTDVANACIYLLSPASRWITGTEFYLDGGFSLT